ncbi:MAG: hypothetical protein HY512_04235 [Candidatus Aenigmarchaeota archaeon]|nr:hypothetical protein [Candidatus Aenigmarchaeota archaeon]
MRAYRIKGDVFYTPIRRYARGEQTVISIASVHVGRQEYWDDIQGEINKIKFGLYEGISREPPSQNTNPKIDNLSGTLDDISDFAAICLGGIFQNNALNYPTSWESPDLSMDDVANSVDKNMMEKAEKARWAIDHIRRLHETYPKEVEAIIGRGFIFLSRFGLLDKLFSLESGKVYRDVLEKRRDAILIESANSKLNANLEELGIIYGAAHMRCLDKHLRYDGFRLEDERWLAALDLSDRLPFWKSLFSLARSIKRDGQQITN